MEIEDLVSPIVKLRSELAGEHALLAGISGIDASGKGFVTDQLGRSLTSQRYRTAVINIDGWLNLPQVRFDPKDLPGNFYRNGIRFDDMFENLVVPLRQTRSADLIADFAEETATEFRKHRYRFDDIDIILLEGIFLFKREFAKLYDLRIWIECSFETALERAIVRSQEGLDPDETIAAYEKIYFPAQMVHREKDEPLAAADIIFENK